MPDDLGRWIAIVREHSVAAGHALSAEVVTELAEYVQDLYVEAIDSGASDAEALGEVSRALARADYADLSTCRRAVPPTSPVAPPPPAGRTWLQGLGSDCRNAWRQARRQPALAIAAAAILALGIGAATAAYAVLEAVVLRPLPYPNPAGLVVMTHVTSTGESRAFATADWTDYQASSGELLEIAASASWPMNLTGSGAPERLRSVIVSGHFFEIVGREASLGRVIGEADDQPAAPRVVVLADGFWRRRFGADRSVLGTEIVVGGRPAAVIGVMPPDFAVPARDVDVWMPFGLPAAVLQDRRSEWVSLLARLHPGVDVRRAQAALDATATTLAEDHPDTNGGDRIRVRALAADVVKDASRAIWLGLLAAVLVLLTSCGNAGHLMVVRAAARREEMAIRASLGAAPLRLHRQLLMESAVVTLAGGLLGVVAAIVFLRVLTTLGAERIPRLDQLDLSPIPLATAALASMCVALAVSLVAHRFVVRAALNDRPGSGTRVVSRGAGHWLLAVQVAFALTLMSATALVVQGYVSTARIDPGFDTADTLTMQLTVPRDRYPDSGAHARIAVRLISALGDIPGVTSVGLVTDLPFVANAMHFAVALEGTPAAGERQMTVRPADPGYFRTLRIPVLEGRSFGESDDVRAPLVAVVNRSAADMLRLVERPGAQLRIAGEPPRMIVGIVGDIRHAGLHDEEGPVVYVPYAQKTFDFVNWMGVVLRGPAVERLVPDVRRAVQGVDPDQPVQAIRTMAAYLDDERAPFELSAMIVGALALSAMVLALAGIYAATAFLVGLLSRELGVRIALGASKRRILALVMTSAAKPIAIGTALGIAGGFAASGLLRALVVSAAAPEMATVFLCASLLLAAVAAAALHPALLATRVDPKTSLDN
jgi:putative ABC transport system permease protein